MAKTSALKNLIALTTNVMSPETVNGEEIPFRGATTAEYLVLLRRFPILKSIITGSSLEITEDMTPDEVEAAKTKQGSRVFEAIVAEAPEAIAAWVCICTGDKGDKEAEAGVLSLPDDVFFRLATIARERTMPKGAEAFFLGLQNMSAILGEAPKPANQDEENDQDLPLAS